MDQEKRIKAFEAMLQAVQENLQTTEEKMSHLKAQGKEKSATYRQLMGNKLQYQNMMAMYKLYGLLDE